MLHFQNADYIFHLPTVYKMYTNYRARAALSNYAYFLQPLQHSRSEDTNLVQINGISVTAYCLSNIRTMIYVNKGPTRSFVRVVI